LSDCSNKECGRADANQHDDDGDDLALGCLWRDVAADGGHGGDGPIEAVPKADAFLRGETRSADRSCQESESGGRLDALK
jgi:hypothetical protein